MLSDITLKEYSNALPQMLQTPQEMGAGCDNYLAEALKIGDKTAQSFKQPAALEVVEFPPEWSPWI